MSTNRSSVPTGIIPHGANYLAHTPLYIDRRLEWSVSPFQVGGGGISVRARGLCDISRLPIWLVEWTPSNYSCSYCLINLPVSLLDDPPPLPPPPHTIFFFFFPFLQKNTQKLSDGTLENTTEIPLKTIGSGSTACPQKKMAWLQRCCGSDSAGVMEPHKAQREFQTIHYISGFKLCSLESNND